MHSFPIPASGDPHRLGNLRPRGQDLAGLAADLTRGAISSSTQVHLDPDLEASSVTRPHGWCPALGQTAAAQSHLERQGVGPGDLFLFFGWFREVEHAAGSWRYRRGAPDMHVLFGWLQVAERVDVGQNGGPTARLFPSLAGHPHVVGASRYSSSNNSIYIGRQSLLLAGHQQDCPGAGTFTHFRNDLQLTAPGRTRSWWRLPLWFHPRPGRSPLSYHADPQRWSLEAEATILRLVDKGQEFVLDTTDYPEATDWIADLLGART